MNSETHEAFEKCQKADVDRHHWHQDLDCIPCSISMHSDWRSFTTFTSLILPVLQCCCSDFEQH